MPTFCRHNRFLDRCPICGPEARASSAPASRPARAPRGSSGARRFAPARARRNADLRVRREQRAADDGYASALVPGLRASDDARRLADEISFSVARLGGLATAPPGLYADVASAADAERAAWLAFLIAHVGAREAGDPFESIVGSGLAATSGPADPAVPGALAQVQAGPRGARDPAAMRTIEAYRAWAERSGSQAAGFTGDPSWPAQRRFERVYERIALPGMTRAARYDLLVTLGRLGRFELHATSLALVGEDDVVQAAKRIFGIGDTINLERRAATLARAADVPIESLDLALYNWSGARRLTLGAPPDEQDAAARDRVARALGL